jgi:hypothetical protein
MSDHSATIEELVRVIRGRLYRDRPAREFFAERQMLLAVVSYPASWLHRRGGAITPAAYSALVRKILDGIWQHGNLPGIRNVPRYLLKAVQEHMKHHGDEILDKQKATAVAIRRTMRGLVADRPQAAAHPLVEELATVHSLLRPQFKKRGRKQPATAPEPTLPGLL